MFDDSCFYTRWRGEGKRKNHEGKKNVFTRQIARYGDSLCGAYADEPMALGCSTRSVTSDGGAQNSLC